MIRTIRPSADTDRQRRRPMPGVARSPILAIVALLLAAALAPSTALAQRLGTVDRIEVVGNRAADQALVLNSIGFGVGDPLTRAAVSQAIRRLEALGLFDDVDIYGEETSPGRIAIEIRVVEKRRLAKLEFESTRSSKI